MMIIITNKHSYSQSLIFIHSLNHSIKQNFIRTPKMMTIILSCYCQKQSRKLFYDLYRFLAINKQIKLLQIEVKSKVITFNKIMDISSFDLVNNQFDKIKVFIGLTITWFALYAQVHLSFHSKKLKMQALLDTRNRIISMVHGLGSFFMACTIFFTTNFNEPNTAFINFICLFSLSYILYDTVACLYFGLWDNGLVIHHGLCILGFGSALWFNYGGIDSVGGLFVAEVSNFPMHLRVVLRNYGLRYTKAYEYSQNFYLASYIIARGIIGLVSLLWPSLTSPNSPIMVKIICFSLTVQSLYYILQMSKIIRKKISQYKEMKEKNISYQWFGETQEIQKLSFYRASDGPKIF